MSLQWMHTNAPCLHTALVYTALVYTARQAKQHAQPWTVHGTAWHGMAWHMSLCRASLLCERRHVCLSVRADDMYR